MSDGERRTLSLRERIKRWLLGSTYVDFGPDRYVIEIHEGKLPRIKKIVLAALDHPLITTIVGGLVVAGVVSAVSVLF